MRTLEINKFNIWVVSDIKEEEVIDDNGFFTGEIELTYGIPKKVRLSLYPATGDIKEETFGKDAEFDMVTVTIDTVLNKNDLLFLEEPTGNYDKTYDYKVKYILKSLNSYRYGLKGRI